MPQLIRRFCVCLGVTIVVALQAHGVINTQHRLEHGLQFPGVSYAEAAMIDHDHGPDHGHEHDRDQSESLPTNDAAATDLADGPGDGPIKHHHHSGGDIHVALSTPALPTGSVIATSVHLVPGPGLAPPGFRGDGPSHPPKQQRLIA